MITKAKWERLLAEMQAVGLEEKDLREKTTAGSGPGGQKVNRSKNAVHLIHLPTKIAVFSHASRSLEHNRYEARKKLVESLKKEVLAIPTKKELLRQKIRKQKQRRRRRQEPGN